MIDENDIGKLCYFYKNDEKHTSTLGILTDFDPKATRKYQCDFKTFYSNCRLPRLDDIKKHPMKALDYKMRCLENIARLAYEAVNAQDNPTVYAEDFYEAYDEIYGKGSIFK